MDEDLHHLGEELATTSARVVRWLPTDSFSLSMSAVRLLARISDHGPTRISDLAVQERCSQPTITNHIKRLEAAGLVARGDDPRDGRAWMIDLTPSGRQQLEQMKRDLGTSLEPQLAQLTKRDVKALRDGLSVIHRLLSLDHPAPR